MANNQGKESPSSSPSTSPSPSSNPTAHNTASRRRTIVLFFLGAIVVPIAAAIAPMMMAPNPHLSTQQRNQDAMVFLGIGFSAALGLAAYLYYDKQQQQQQQQQQQKQAASDTSKTRGGAGAGASAASKAPASASASSESSSSSSKQQPKDIWKVGASSTTGLKKPKVAYNEKPFGSKYYYAHNDSNTTGGYKDGLKMEDYRMNGPRLLSVNGLAVTDQDKNDNENIDNENIDNENIDEPSDSGASVEPRNNNNNERASSKKPSAKPRITARDPHTKNVTRYLWDDSGNGKGIATIRVDVLPGNKLGEFVDWKDAGVVDVKASLPGEGLLAEIITVRDRPDVPVPSYRLKIDKLYGDAADVKVILKPKRLLLKIFKKKHGFLSKNSDNMGAWPQPHRKL